MPKLSLMTCSWSALMYSAVHCFTLDVSATTRRMRCSNSGRVYKTGRSRHRPARLAASSDLTLAIQFLDRRVGKEVAPQTLQRRPQQRLRE